MDQDRAHDGNVVELFLAGAEVVRGAIGSRVVAEQWDRPSVLEEQTVGSLAGHLARGGVWVVGDYLDGPEPEGPVTYETAGAYFADIASRSTADDHRAIRDRGAALAAMGQRELVERLGQRLDDLAPRLRSLPADRLIAVIAGRVLRLGDYLTTRIVEQTVHLDDLARSVGGEGSDVPEADVPEAAQRLVLDVGMEIGWRRHGNLAMIRTLYRGGFAGHVPVM